jgi:hypothetical protein
LLPRLTIVLARLLGPVGDVDGDDAGVRVHVLEDHRPQDGASPMGGAGLHEDVGLHLEEDLLGDPGVVGIGAGVYPLSPTEAPSAHATRASW